MILYFNANPLLIVTISVQGLFSKTTCGRASLGMHLSDVTPAPVPRAAIEPRWSGGVSHTHRRANTEEEEGEAGVTWSTVGGCDTSSNTAEISSSLFTPKDQLATREARPEKQNTSRTPTVSLGQARHFDNFGARGESLLGGAGGSTRRRRLVGQLGDDRPASFNCLLCAESNCEKSVDFLFPTLRLMPVEVPLGSSTGVKSDGSRNHRSATFEGSTSGEIRRRLYGNTCDRVRSSFSRVKEDLQWACFNLPRSQWHLSPLKSRENDVLNNTRKSLYFINTASRVSHPAELQTASSIVQFRNTLYISCTTAYQRLLREVVVFCFLSAVKLHQRLWVKSSLTCILAGRSTCTLVLKYSPEMNPIECKSLFVYFTVPQVI